MNFPHCSHLLAPLPDPAAPGFLSRKSAGPMKVSTWTIAGTGALEFTPSAHSHFLKSVGVDSSFVCDLGEGAS